MKKYTYFPPQKIPTRQKTKSWFKDCIDAAENMIVLESGELEYKRKMQVWYDLYDDIINEEEIESVFNPMKINKGFFPASTKNYPICAPKIDLLGGEEIKRRFEWSVISRNEDAFSNYSKNLRDDILSSAMQFAKAEAKDEKELESKLKGIIKYYSYEYKELNEVTAARILQYLWREQDIQEKFSEAFKDALKGGREIYRIDDYGEKPVLVKCDPRNVYPLRRGNSSKMEDSDLIIEINYEPVGKVIDEFYDDLKASDIDAIESAYENTKKNGSGGVLSYMNKHSSVIYSNFDFESNTVIPVDGIGSEDVNHAFGLPFDENGNVRVIRARWLSRKKIGKLTYFDDNGNEQQKFVSENYKPKEEFGEHVKWIWVNEACEAHKIAEDIYPRCGIRSVQMRHFDNPSMCFLGYVGTDYKDSMMKRMEPYQYLYNVYMRRLELVLARFKGPIIELDISKKPDDWDLEQWMYYADVLGYRIVDSFREGKKGSATGKLAGSFNTTGGVIDPKIGDYIQQLVLMLQYIESQVGKISGVTEQREGQISNRETVGGVERAVTQSSHITENWFFIHEQTKKRVLQALLDTAKQLYSKSKSVNLNFILDDMSRVFLQFNGEDFASSEYDIFVSNSSVDQDIRELVKQLSHAAVQNGASMLLPIRILRSDSISDMAKKLEIEEQEKLQREQELENRKLEVQDKISQREAEQKEKDRELEYYKADRKFEEAVTVAAMRNDQEAPEDNSIDKEKLNLDKKKQTEDSSLRRDQLKETIRHNKATEAKSNTQKTATPKAA